MTGSPRGAWGHAAQQRGVRGKHVGLAALGALATALTSAARAGAVALALPLALALALPLPLPLALPLALSLTGHRDATAAAPLGHAARLRR